jgi:hypothetical protein
MVLRFFRKGGGNEEEEYDEEFLRDHEIIKILDDDINEYSKYEFYSTDPNYDPNEFFMIGITQKLKIPKITIGGDRYTPILTKLEKSLKPYANIRIKGIISDEMYNREVFGYVVSFPENAIFEVIDYDKKYNTLISQFLRPDNVGFEWNCGFMSKIVEIVQQEGAMTLMEAMDKLFRYTSPDPPPPKEVIQVHTTYMLWAIPLLIGLGVLELEGKVSDFV